MNKEITIVRAGNSVPDVDLENRILRNAVVSTDSLASDGWILLPRGIVFDKYMTNPVVLARHGYADTADPLTVAKTLNLVPSDPALTAEVQFADTERGRDYAYLYGINPKKEVYMRGWSIRGPVLEEAGWTWDEAKAHLGSRWDENMAAQLKRWNTMVYVGLKTVLQEFSCVELPADRDALTRADKDGVKTAGMLIARMDLSAAESQIADLKLQIANLKKSTEEEFLRMELASLVKQAQALGSDGAAAAARGDTAELLRELGALMGMIKRN